MRDRPLNIVVLGLSITSSWGNGHATTYRALLKQFNRRGHHTLFLERDRPWYAESRDLANPEFCTTRIYSSLEELRDVFSAPVRRADAVIVGSFVPDGVEVGEWVLDTAEGATAFYDIDTPVTLDRLQQGGCEYIAPFLIPRYDAYFSFSGGPRMHALKTVYGASMTAPLYCSVDPDVHRPFEAEITHALGYLGTYSADRQAALERLMLEPARRLTGQRFVVAGSQYPDGAWPENVDYVDHVAPSRHAEFYGSQRFTLNVTRAPMVAFGYSPSVRLFEAACCGAPIISDLWPGIESFFDIGREILPSSGTEDTLRFLNEISEMERRKIGARARRRVRAEHSAARRAEQLEEFLMGLLERRAARIH